MTLLHYKPFKEGDKNIIKKFSYLVKLNYSLSNNKCQSSILAKHKDTQEKRFLSGN